MEQEQAESTAAADFAGSWGKRAVRSPLEQAG
jgi:hypothetical protein